MSATSTTMPVIVYSVFRKFRLSSSSSSSPLRFSAISTVSPMRFPVSRIYFSVTAISSARSGSTPLSTYGTFISAPSSILTSAVAFFSPTPVRTVLL